MLYDLLALLVLSSSCEEQLTSRQLATQHFWRTVACYLVWEVFALPTIGCPGWTTCIGRINRCGNLRCLAWSVPVGAGFPIDRFILARLESHNLHPAPAATPRALIRRVYLDLIGLPPPPAAIDAFLAGDFPHAYDRLLDDLLAHPSYGERWGRHWLDLVRFAETNGYEIDGEKPFAWKYRDYVIEALNSDKPYDRFVLEQLAGDELPDASTESVIATGFNRVGPWDAERGASVQKSEVIAERYNELDDMVSTTSMVLLGLTMGCARCHDHKFDPLTNRDYYSMVAVFHPLKRSHIGREEQADPAVPPRVLKANPDITSPKGYFFREDSSDPPETRLLKRGNPNQPGPIVSAGGSGGAGRTATRVSTAR